MTGSRTRACFTCVSHMCVPYVCPICVSHMCVAHVGRGWDKVTHCEEVHQAPYAQQGDGRGYDHRKNDFYFCERNARHACLVVGRCPLDGCSSMFIFISCPCISVINALTCDSTICSFASADAIGSLECTIDIDSSAVVTRPFIIGVITRRFRIARQTMRGAQCV